MKIPSLDKPRRKEPGKRLKERFRVVQFINRSGTQSWRVDGVKRDGERVRLNYQDQAAATLKRNELDMEFHDHTAIQDSAIRSTRLSEDALRIAERCLGRLDQPDDLLLAVDHWLRVGRHQKTPAESPRLDKAVEEFMAWVADTPTLRPSSKQSLRTRVVAQRFGNSEGIIKRHYQGRVSTGDTKRFYSIKPSRKGGSR